MTGADLRAVSGLPRRTVYSALRILRERGAVHQRKSLHDTRQTYFWLTEFAGSRPLKAATPDRAAPRPAPSPVR
jgi:DNA-binding MarR family transcriptional regulator